MPKYGNKPAKTGNLTPNVQKKCMCDRKHVSKWIKLKNVYEIIILQGKQSDFVA